MFLTLALTGLGIVPWDLTGLLIGDLVGSLHLVWVCCRKCCKGGRSHGKLWASQLPLCDVHSPRPRGAKHQEGWNSEGWNSKYEKDLQESKTDTRGRNHNVGRRKPKQRQETRGPANRGQSTPLRKPAKEPRCQERARDAGPIILEGSRAFSELNP